LVGNSAAFAAAAPAAPSGGTTKIYAVLPGNGTTGPILFIGAVADFGKYMSVDKNGKLDPNGNYVKMVLQKGTFEVNSTALNAKASSDKPAFFDQATCSAVISVSDPVTLLAGTRSYAGITGTINVSETYAFILPRYTSGADKGQCNLSNSAQTTADYGTITGSGTVHFS
jgi:hypothetical protein